MSAFRTDPIKTRQIGFLACFLGYLMILPGVPVIAGALNQALILIFKGSGITQTAIGPAAQSGELLIEALSFSFIASWMGVLVSIPVVIWARLKGWFGWATAALTGAVEGFVLLPMFFGVRFDGDLIVYCIGSAMLGLSFWGVVRFIHSDIWAAEPLIED